MISFFHSVFYTPLYNGLIFLLNFIPWYDLGIAVVVFTFLVKLVLYPLSKKSVVTQFKMKQIEPELKAIKEKYKNNAQEQAKRTMDFYREKGINPFAGILLILIQIPIIFSLYFIFYNSGLPELRHDLLYSFIKLPPAVNMHFLGLIDISKQSTLLAIFAGVSNFFQIRLSVPSAKPLADGQKPSFQDDLARSMNIQMRYVLPVVVFLISFTISGAVALYWTTSNLFMMGQEIFVRRKLKK